MNGRVSTEELADQIRTCYRSSGSKAEVLIEGLLDKRLEGFSLEEKLAFMEELNIIFGSSLPRPEIPVDQQESELLASLFSMILGQRISIPDLGSKDLLHRLARSLNKVFDQLNELVSIIQSTFGEGSRGLETIRHIIGSEMDNDSQSGSLESYIGQVKEAFLIGRQAFQLAAHKEVGKMLAELDPDHIGTEAEKGLRFGFMKKAEFFEAYREKFEKIKKWYESERFEEDFSREFERSCERLHLEKRRAM
jgi:hypothetical protein